MRPQAFIGLPNPTTLTRRLNPNGSATRTQNTERSNPMSRTAFQTQIQAVLDQFAAEFPINGASPLCNLADLAGIHAEPAQPFDLAAELAAADEFEATQRRAAA